MSLYKIERDNSKDGNLYAVYRDGVVVSAFSYLYADAEWILRRARYYIDRGVEEEMAFIRAHRELDAH